MDDADAQILRLARGGGADFMPFDMQRAAIAREGASSSSTKRRTVEGLVKVSASSSPDRISSRSAGASTSAGTLR